MANESAMKVELIDAAAVRTRLPMAACIEAMELAMRSLSTGSVAAPHRMVLDLIDHSGKLLLMPGSAALPRAYGLKAVSIHPGNAAAGLPVVQGFVALFDPATGAPLALLDGAAVTTLRTGAASALATRTLARRDATTLGIFGCGVQAGVHLEAMSSVRELSEILIWGRSVEKVRSFIARHRGTTRARLRVADRPEQAAECDIVCATTSASEPVLHGVWVKPGAHVNLVGAYTATMREADSELIRRSRLYVDSRAAAFVEAGDILMPLREGAITAEHVIGEIGEVLVGSAPGRRSRDEITVYKSVGVVAQDLMAAHAVYTARSVA